MRVAATSVNAVVVHTVYHAPIAKIVVTLLVVAITVTRYDHATAGTGQHRTVPVEHH
jgi:hypothetical protein